MQPALRSVAFTGVRLSVCSGVCGAHYPYAACSSAPVYTACGALRCRSRSHAGVPIRRRCQLGQQPALRLSRGTKSCLIGTPL
ncbi:hypothetical protein EYF80_056032 [Liparis tanakae]|uniref:Uncharacterized protein n=1 Tax=Liparis tanakae TaxID=230148 RepID=A0A4Z2EYG5_9TELE|nr:hypothetical protein EYF80_056032 [Liparis tanakae]